VLEICTFPLTPNNKQPCCTTPVESTEPKILTKYSQKI
jgi:hypothetical protein